ncbi:type II secretion system F family protein [Jeotgalibacillus haloalkalitolerans]|uniref:Type II secretion system F family protein n=1 Tax=Jeotgalibacillus haloalkalitolerans TaxID=3104292 RepID=A0ABU5KMK5_9BACL|nr:type II secretion system F family protein [Jeotgalibacillus sp. HH7-29]MDZ5712367.1 type II secretion system F family protein [Jeotgalibacillus sp. HH7-29]
MTIYKYTGRTSKGTLKKGTIDSISERQAIAKLREDGISIREISQSNNILHKEIYLKPQVSHKDFVVFCRQFSTLIKAGIPIVDSTGILASQLSGKQLQKTLLLVKDDIQTGTSLSEAVGKYPKVFPAIFINMIKAGEASGRLDETLERLADYFEKQYNLRKKVQSALAYPIMLTFLTFGVVIFLMTTIVPRFTDMFAQMDAELPAITKSVLVMSEFVQSFWWLLFLLLAGIITGFYIALQKSGSFRYSVSVVWLKIPLFGPLLQKSLIARMTRTLSSLFASSVPILQAITIVQRVIDHPAMEKVLTEARENLQTGGTLSEPLEKSWIFPPMVYQMTLIGERSGTLDMMLENIADFYEAEVERTVDTLKSLIEPIMIVILAAVVGVIVLAIMVPLFTLYDQL